MLLLVTDTSGKHGSVALARADSNPSNIGVNKPEVIESMPLAGGTFSAQLVPQIAALLAKHKFSKRDIEAFVVVSGPGSFTGLRVGLAAIKALAEILRKPIVPVSLLEVVAISAESHGSLVAALDAGRGEIYAGEYELVKNGAGLIVARLVQERLLPRDEFLTMAQQTVVATPNEDLAKIAHSAGIRIISVAQPGAATIAQVGWRKLQAGEIATPEQLEANYIRRSDAETFAKLSKGVS
jgi:tRNA threonylcarbamoyladenosine biosynthesis protein TsaB